jgi:hypothetical protein
MGFKQSLPVPYYLDLHIKHRQEMCKHVISSCIGSKLGHCAKLVYDFLDLCLDDLDIFIQLMNFYPPGQSLRELHDPKQCPLLRPYFLKCNDPDQLRKISLIFNHLRTNFPNDYHLKVPFEMIIEPNVKNIYLQAVHGNASKHFPRRFSHYCSSCGFSPLKSETVYQKVETHVFLTDGFITKTHCYNVVHCPHCRHEKVIK